MARWFRLVWVCLLYGGIGSDSPACAQEVTGVSPTRGGTGGGTILTVTGTGFGSNIADISVRIAGSQCVVISVSNTEITCKTSSHNGSVKASVEVREAGVSGMQLPQETNFDFWYIDVWSSPFTWGGSSLPEAGDFVIVPKGRTVLLDTDTDIIKVILIQGGELIFDEQNIELHAEIILITDGGKLQIGTESNPFQHKAAITLHGHLKSKELPIYGTKTLAVREGTLDLHGKPLNITWTRLAETATAGESVITLQKPVDWNLGDEIIIATTGGTNSQAETEQHTIFAISDDHKTLTLTKELAYNHLGISEVFAGTNVEFRAEVGLLTRNVKIQGSLHSEWENKPCDTEEFDPGQFGIQRCFQERSGDGFGGHIMIHSLKKNTHKTLTRISFVEVFNAGQEFRLGRYPIHFHLNGDASGSYVKGCAIHRSYNRAITLHGIHNILIEHNVMYNIKGNAVFMEDGIEQGNTVQYNLVVFVRPSYGLANVDITPANFLISNPNNTFQHNIAAGGTHHGFWYKMPKHPKEPSVANNVCPDKTPLKMFFNNSAHSFGGIGLLIFNFYPMTNGCTGVEPEPATLRSLKAWNTEKGVSFANLGDVTFNDFILVDNTQAGVEAKPVAWTNVSPSTGDSPMISDSLIVAQKDDSILSTQECTASGIVFLCGVEIRIKDVRLVNFNKPECVAFRFARNQELLCEDCAGSGNAFEGITFENSPHKAALAHNIILHDKDGSLSSKPGWKIVPKTGINPVECVDLPEYSYGVSASLCPQEYKFHTVYINGITPTRLKGRRIILQNKYGISDMNFHPKRLAHKSGWMANFVGKETFTMRFENIDQMTNISYNATFYPLKHDEFIFVKVQLSQKPDRVTFDGGLTYIEASNTSVDAYSPNAKTGDYEWDALEKTIKYLVRGNSRYKRSPVDTNSDHQFIRFSAYQCYRLNCEEPPLSPHLPTISFRQITSRPTDAQMWSNQALWMRNSQSGYTENSAEGDGTYGLPKNGDNVEIVHGTWVVADQDFPKLKTLVVYGTLEFDGNVDSAGQYKTFTLSAEYILVYGHLIVGSKDRPFLGDASFILRGSPSSEEFPRTTGPALGAKAIGVFGQLDLHGQDVGITWTKLKETARAGTNQLTLVEAVKWKMNDEILVTTTSYSPWQTETFKITSVSANGLTLTLNATLKYTHISHFETLTSGDSLDMRGEVGLLTRNIKVLGEEYSELWTDGFGARILVSGREIGEAEYKGGARVSNVEFYQTGQKGYGDNYDPRFSVAFMNAAESINGIPYSYVKKSAFHHGYNTAIGVYGTEDVTVENNVIHHTVGSALVIESVGSRVIRNLVVLTRIGQYYEHHTEPQNVGFVSSVEAFSAEKILMIDNIVAGSEGGGYHVQPEDCSSNCSSNSATYRNNVVHGCLSGVTIFPDDATPFQCVKVTGYTAWKNSYFGVYYQSNQSLNIYNNTLSENGVGIFTMINGPSSKQHDYADKSVTVNKVRLVGTTTSFNCTSDVQSMSDVNIKLGERIRSAGLGSGGRVGVMMPNFVSSSNGAPENYFDAVLDYGSIKGVMKVSEVHIANFGTRCFGIRDYALSTNPVNEAVQHPMEVQSITRENVDHDSLIMVHRPNTGNRIACEHMDCDGLKKVLIKDKDGSLLGFPGTVIPHSELELSEGELQSLGDSLIPKVMLTNPNGTRIQVDEIAPNKGIIRNKSCTQETAWQAWKCFGLDHLMLVIESLDNDTEVRRIAPLAVLADGYLDLISGSQDRGLFTGSASQKRLSKFTVIIASGSQVHISMTGFEPEETRFFLLNSNASQSVRLALQYLQTNGIDVYSNGDHVPSTNSKPDAENASGTNYLDRNTQTLHFLIKGPNPVTIFKKSGIFVNSTMPAVQEDDFYGDDVHQMLLSYFGIPKTNAESVYPSTPSGEETRNGWYWRGAARRRRRSVMKESDSSMQMQRKD